MTLNNCCQLSELSMLEAKQVITSRHYIYSVHQTEIYTCCCVLSTQHSVSLLIVCNFTVVNSICSSLSLLWYSTFSVVIFPSKLLTMHKKTLWIWLCTAESVSLGTHRVIRVKMAVKQASTSAHVHAHTHAQRTYKIEFLYSGEIGNYTVKYWMECVQYIAYFTPRAPCPLGSLCKVLCETEFK